MQCELQEFHGVAINMRIKIVFDFWSFINDHECVKSMRSDVLFLKVEGDNIRSNNFAGIW